MPCRVKVTPLAKTQADALRGPQRKRLEDAIREIEQHGCAALDYRLSGSDLLERLCVKHLRGPGRLVVCFAEPELAWLLLVGEHTDDPGRNVYDMLYVLVDHEPEPNTGRSKPSCCEDGHAPLVEDPLVDDLVDRTRDLLGRRRSRR
ncbi:hypothetical protein [Modestobacter sp. KNN46-3]|uniref:hypothetical protein n=1 Tax=Modestobacter sp. KNN46-3 TaxID=2711218 RepID=UPI0013E053FA|nr:hypothetical protein [Modestobacter sp. KNN46-3]